jgi:hypothetical protein
MPGFPQNLNPKPTEGTAPSADGGWAPQGADVCRRMPGFRLFSLARPFSLGSQATSVKEGPNSLPI